MDALQVARLVEGSEAAAYSSLVVAPSIEARARFGLDARRHGGAVAVVARAVVTSLNFNRVIGLGVDEPATEAALDEMIAPYLAQGLSYAVELSPAAEPPELSSWLKARRLRKAMTSAMHYRETGPSLELPNSPHVMRASSSDRRRVADICCSVFSMPEATHAIICATADKPDWHQWLACDDAGEPLAAGLSFIREGIGWFGWDATLPAARGRGAQSALIAYRLADAADRGCRFVTAETATYTAGREDASMRNYRRCGFSLAYERATHVRAQPRSPL
jgi:GNAT superfamily N-acetyltransferase